MEGTTQTQQRKETNTQHTTVRNCLECRGELLSVKNLSAIFVQMAGNTDVPIEFCDPALAVVRNTFCCCMILIVSSHSKLYTIKYI